MKLKYCLAALLALVLAGCSQSAHHYVEVGNGFFANGELDDASLNYRKAIQRDSNYGDAYYRLGLCSIKQEKGLEAMQSLQKAVDLMPNNVDAKVKLADLALGGYQLDPQSKSLYELVVKLSGQLLQKDPNQFDGLRLAGNMELLGRRPAEAIQYFEKAQKAKPFQEYLIVGYTQALLQLNEVDRAVQLANGMIEKNKAFASSYDILYRYYASVKQPALAEQILRRKVLNNPAQTGYAIQLASHFRQLANVQASDDVLQHILQSAKPDSDAYLHVGDFQALQREADKAVGTYEAGKSAAPGRILEYDKRIAVVKAAAGQTDEAITILDAVRAKAPKDWEAAGTEADMLLLRAKRDDVLKAIPIYQSFLKLQPNNGKAFFNLGRALILKGDMAEARKALTDSARLDSGSAAPRLLLASLSLREREPNGALRYALDALARTPADPRASFMKSAALMDLARYDEAQVELSKLAQQVPDSREVRIQQGLLAILQKNFPEAERIFSDLAAKGPADPRAIGGLAETYVAQQQFDRALRFLESEQKKDPKSDVVQRLIAATAARSGKYDRAIEEYQSLLDRYNRSSTLMLGLGDAYREKGDLSNAIAQFQRAGELSPNDPTLHLLEGFAFQQKGEMKKAIDSYRKTIALDPRNGIAMNNLAYLLASTSDVKSLDEALDLAKRAVAGNGDPADSRDTLGWIYLKKGMPDSALQIFESLARDQPQNTSFQYHLGLARAQKRDLTGARKAYLLALANKPSESDAAEIQGALAKLR